MDFEISWASALDERQAGIRGIPRGAQPSVMRIFSNRKCARRASQTIQIVHVITRPGDYGVVSTVYQNCVPVVRLQDLLAQSVSGIQLLQREAFRLLDSIVVNFIEIDLQRGIVDLVLVRRIAGPVAAGSINLNYHQFIRWKSGWHDVYDLPGGISAAAQITGDVAGSDQLWRKFGVRRYTAFGNLAGRLRGEGDAVTCR